MTKGQRIALQSEWWPAACAAQGWKVSDRDLRLRVCAWALSLADPTQLELLQAIHSDRQPARQLTSTNDLDNRADIDRVKACLLMLAYDVDKTKEVGRPEYGSARRKRDVIRSHLKCLALFEEHPGRFMASLVEDMFNHGQPGVTIQDLNDMPNLGRDGKPGPSDLDRLVMRMAQIVNDRRRSNVLVGGWTEHQRRQALTIHEMKVLAGVDCDCAQCRRMQRTEDKPAPIEDWSDLEAEGDVVYDPENCPF